MAGGIPGWAPLDERTLTGDPAYRPIAEVIREVFRVYRRDARRFLLASAAIQIPLALLVAPYLALSWGILADAWRRFPTLEIPPGFAIYADPPFGALSGLALATPFVGFVLVTAVVAGVVLRPPGEPDSTTMRRNRGLRIAVICAAIFGVGAVVGLASSRVMAGWLARGFARPDPGSMFGILGVEVLVFGAVIIGGYALVRSGLAIPALVFEGLGIRGALARSIALTRRRSMRTALTFTVGLAVVGAANSVFSVSAFALALASSSAGASALAVPVGGLFLLTSVLVAPVLPIIATILYRDFRDAGPLLNST